jgi:copper(I)-binding protein
MMRRFLLWLFFVPPIALTACSNPVNPPEIYVENASVRMPAPGQTTAVAYFDVINSGGPDRLMSVHTPISSNAELHTHLHEDGIMKMRRVEQVDIPEKQTTSFEPGGNHVMIFEATIPSRAESISLTLNFEIIGEIQINAQVSD